MKTSFAKIVKGFQSLTIFAKSSILDVWQGSEYACGIIIWYFLKEWCKIHFTDNFSLDGVKPSAEVILGKLFLPLDPLFPGKELVGKAEPIFYEPKKYHNIKLLKRFNLWKPFPKSFYYTDFLQWNKNKVKPNGMKRDLWHEMG